MCGRSCHAMKGRKRSRSDGEASCVYRRRKERKQGCARKEEARGKGEVGKPGSLAAAVHELAGNSNLRSKECKQPQSAKDADRWLEQASSSPTATGKRIKAAITKRNKKQLEELQKYFEDLDQEKLEEETPVKTTNHQPKARHGHATTTVAEIVPRELSTEELLEMYPSIRQHYKEYKAMIGLSPMPLRDFAKAMSLKLRDHCPLVPRALLLDDEAACTARSKHSDGK